MDERRCSIDPFFIKFSRVNKDDLVKTEISIPAEYGEQRGCFEQLDTEFRRGKRTVSIYMRMRVKDQLASGFRRKGR